ncbi:metallophosphoesterase [Leptolyngbya sp. FACHB-261]|nr:metallophosphoesterase [Leptolyngbya sp. FACHB-261]
MPLKRRQLLTWTGLAGLGAATACMRSRAGSSQTNPPAASAAIPTPVPTTPAGPQLRFAAVADTGTGGEGQYAVAKAMAGYHAQNPFPLVVLAGDNIYNNGEIEKISAVFEQPYETLLNQGVKFRACLGNHDIRTANGEPQLRYPGFNMEGRYYTFTQAPVQFFALDTNGNAAWRTQLAWLDQELSRSTAPWKVVFGHHPVYSSGHYGVNRAFIRDLTPLFEKHRVQLYINGHDHSYERTQVINGTTYLICGAGAGTRPVGRSGWTAHSAQRLSFAGLEVYDDRIEIEAIGTDGSVFDRGVIKL